MYMNKYMVYTSNYSMQENMKYVITIHWCEH